MSRRRVCQGNRAERGRALGRAGAACDARPRSVEGAPMADDQPFPVNAVNVVRTAQQINVQLSAMADQKASILMGAAFVIFTIAINQAHGALPPLPLLILGASAFVAAACAVVAIMPAVRTKPTAANLLFF